MQHKEEKLFFCTSSLPPTGHVVIPVVLVHERPLLIVMLLEMCDVILSLVPRR